MKINKWLLSLLFLVAFSFNSLNAWSANSDPLMVIRFNQEYVDYASKLDKVVKMALNKKESVFFDVVAVVPVKGPRRQDKRTKKHASLYAKDVVEEIRLLGVDSDQIRLNFQNSTEAQSIEVHIFVR